MSDVLERIGALLAKAENTDNEAEADAYLAKAQEIAVRFSVDLAVARARTQSRHAPTRPTSRTLTIGERGRRANPHLVTLYVAIGHANGLQVDVAHNSTYVIGFGLPVDLDVTEAMYISLATTMVNTANTWLATGEWKGETYVARGHRRMRKQHTAQTARAAFYRAFVDRIARRLEEVNVRVGKEEVHIDESQTVSAALVLRDRDIEVTDFYRSQSQARGSWSGYSGSVSRRAGVASRAGDEAGARARLKPMYELPGKGPGISG